MTQKHYYTIKALAIFMGFYLLAACSSLTPTTAPTAILPTSEPTGTSIAVPSSTPAVNTATAIPPTATARITATSSATPHPTASLTPLPTIDSYGILGLIDNNGGCVLPCWWGIEPGRATSQQALQFLENIPATITSNGDSGSFNVDGKVHFESAYQISYDLPGNSQQGTIWMIVWDDIVTRISIGLKTTQYRYTLDQLLLKIGKPSQVFIEAKHDAMGFTVPYHLILHYPDRRLFANYYMEAENVGERIRACPAKVAPGLILWSPKYRIENRLAEEMLGPDSRPGLQTLKDATGLSTDDFYSIFSRAGFKDCLESPLSFWEDLD